MNPSLDQFEAPELKSAVRRLYAAERAPLGLRQRVEGMLRGAQSQPARPMRIERAEIWRWAAAAIIVIGLVGLTVRVAYERRHPVGGQTLLAMVKVHDYCCRDGNKHRQREIPQESFALIGRSMAGRLKGPVLAGDMEGWNFVGAAMCPINGKPSAHLVYHRNGQWLSIFSIPAASCERVREGAMGGQTINDHMVAGFARTGGVYCMVATCPQKTLQLDEIQQLLKKHQGDLIVPREPRTVAMVEMLRQR